MNFLVLPRMDQVPAIAGSSSGARPYCGPSPMLGRTGGFTLLELIITITIASILLGLAVPGMKGFIENNRVKVAVGQLADSLNYARSEASKRRFPVSVCPSNNTGTSCVGGAVWNGGWLVFTDDDSNGTVDGLNEVLRVVDPLPSQVTLETIGFATSYVQYSATGELNVSGRFKICNNEAGFENISRAIDVSATGRANVDPAKYPCTSL